MSDLPQQPAPRQSTTCAGQLSGVRIIVSRPEEQARMTAAILENEGADVIIAAAIYHDNLLGHDRNALLNTLNGLKAKNGWLILPSPMAIQMLISAVGAMELSVEALDGIKIAVIGKTSATHLKTWGRDPDFAPPEPNGVALAETLPAREGEMAIIAGAAKTRPEVAELLRDRGVRVAHWALYDTKPWAEGLGVIEDVLRRPPDDKRPILLVSAPSAVNAIIDRFSGNLELLNETAWLAIGPTTHRQLFVRGLAPREAIVANTPYLDALVHAARRLKRRLLQT